jgi:hypothetical protein
MPLCDYIRVRDMGGVSFIYDHKIRTTSAVTPCRCIVISFYILIVGTSDRFKHLNIHNLMINWRFVYHQYL